VSEEDDEVRVGQAAAGADAVEQAMSDCPKRDERSTSVKEEQGAFHGAGHRRTIVAPRDIGRSACLTRPCRSGRWSTRISVHNETGTDSYRLAQTRARAEPDATAG
jgi:hypothetical protein